MSGKRSNDEASDTPQSSDSGPSQRPKIGFGSTGAIKAFKGVGAGVKFGQASPGSAPAAPKFGSTKPNPFGSTKPVAFGQKKPTFGQSKPTFGQTKVTPPAFGQSKPPAFGAKKSSATSPATPSSPTSTSTSTSTTQSPAPTPSSPSSATKQLPKANPFKKPFPSALAKKPVTGTPQAGDSDGKDASNDDGSSTTSSPVSASVPKPNPFRKPAPNAVIAAAPQRRRRQKFGGKRAGSSGGDDNNDDAADDGADDDAQPKIPFGSASTIPKKTTNATASPFGAKKDSDASSTAGEVKKPLTSSLAAAFGKKKKDDGAADAGNKTSAVAAKPKFGSAALPFKKFSPKPSATSSFGKKPAPSPTLSPNSASTSSTTQASQLAAKTASSPSNQTASVRPDQLASFQALNSSFVSFIKQEVDGSSGSVDLTSAVQAYIDHAKAIRSSSAPAKSTPATPTATATPSSDSVDDGASECEARCLVRYLDKDDDDKPEWKKKGVGILKVQKLESGGGRLLMRMDDTNIILLNVKIPEKMPLSKKSDKEILASFAVKGDTMVMHLIKCKTEAVTNDLFNAIKQFT